MANVAEKADAVDRKARDHAYYLKNREHILAQQKQYAELHKEARNVRTRERLKKQRDEINRYNRDYRKELRREVLLAYDNQCSCCGELEEAFLEVHHLNGNGNQHRRELGGGSKLYSWLRRNGWPKGFGILCSNCNKAEYNRGICPHRLKKLQGGVN